MLRFFSQLLGESVPLEDLHPDPLVFVNEFLQLSLYILLLEFQCPLGIFEFIESFHEVALVDEHFVLFLHATSVFSLSVVLLLLELCGVTFQYVVLCAHLVSLLVKVLQFFVEIL